MEEQQNKTIILGVTGGIAIHKSIDLASQLVKQGHSVHVVMTENATRLVQPIQFQVISRNPVLLDLFDIGSDWKPVHIDLADKAALLSNRPRHSKHASAKWRTASLTTHSPPSQSPSTVPILIAPAMEQHMYENPFVEANLQELKGTRRRICRTRQRRSRLRQTRHGTPEHRRGHLGTHHPNVEHNQRPRWETGGCHSETHDGNISTQSALSATDPAERWDTRSQKPRGFAAQTFSSSADQPQHPRLQVSKPDT